MPQNETGQLPFVTRIGAPDWVTRPGAGASVPGDVLGGQAEWSFAIPWAYRALASPVTGELVLAAPDEDSPHSHRIAYWATLLHLLCFRLGWFSPERGLDWWREQGYPTKDPTLALIAATWLPDGRLPPLREWLAEQPAMFIPGVFDANWSEAHPDAHREPARRDTYGPWAGPWQLHLEGLGGHVGAPLHNPTNAPHAGAAGNARLLATEPAEGRAVLIVDSMIGWYAALLGLGSTLPPRKKLEGLGPRSWRIEVFARPVGHLDTFRRSTGTGAWTAALDPAVHLAGN